MTTFTLWVRCRHGFDGMERLYEKEVSWDHVPMVGDDVDLTGTGWEEPVGRRSFGRYGRLIVQFGVPTPVPIRHDEEEDTIAVLLAHGWTVTPSLNRD